MNFIDEFKEITQNCYNKGWNEANGGNLTYRLTNNEVNQFSNNFTPRDIISLEEVYTNLIGEYFLVTASGKFFRNVKKSIEHNAGIIKILEDGKSYQIVWGLIDCLPTSELATHLLNHNEMKKVSDEFRVILHGHQTNLIMLSFIMESDVKLTYALWQMMTECLVVFPKGIKWVDWMVPGNTSIAKETATHINDYDVVFWKHHGAFVKGKSFDHAFGLIETVEKAATMYINLLQTNSKVLSTITNENLKLLASEFNVEVPDRYDL